MTSASFASFVRRLGHPSSSLCCCCAVGHHHHRLPPVSSLFSSSYPPSLFFFLCFPINQAHHHSPCYLSRARNHIYPLHSTALLYLYIIRTYHGQLYFQVVRCTLRLPLPCIAHYRPLRSSKLTSCRTGNTPPRRSTSRAPSTTGQRVSNSTRTVTFSRRPSTSRTPLARSTTRCVHEP